jgi:dGTPase
LADDIAYNNHDLHDGLRAGLFSDAEVARLPIVSSAYRDVDLRYPGLEKNRRRHEALRRVFGVMVEDVIETSRERLEEAGVRSVEDVRALDAPVIAFSDGLWLDLQDIRSFLFQRMYRAPKVMEKRAEVSRVVEALFPYFLNNPMEMPDRWHAEIRMAANKTALARLVSDYIAGMTDRFALQLHEQLILGKPSSS